LLSIAAIVVAAIVIVAIVIVAATVIGGVLLLFLWLYIIIAAGRGTLKKDREVSFEHVDAQHKMKTFALTCCAWTWCNAQ
jgi:hypothetical protein